MGKVIRTWKQFAKYGKNHDQLPLGFEYFGGTWGSPYGKGQFIGIVTYHRKPIFADYDIMTIIQSNKKGEFINSVGSTKRGFEINNFDKIKEMLNNGFGKEMIQHGSEFMWEGIGTREQEWIYWFGPGRRFRRGTSGFPQKHTYNVDSN